MASYQIALNLRKKNNSELVVFARHIYKGLLASSVFTSPVPSLAQQLADNDLFAERIKKSGTRGNHGSSLDKALEKESRKKVCKNLTRLANDCYADAPDDVEAVLSA